MGDFTEQQEQDAGTQETLVNPGAQEEANKLADLNKITPEEDDNDVIESTKEEAVNDVDTSLPSQQSYFDTIVNAYKIPDRTSQLPNEEDLWEEKKTEYL
jgi:hypothetical protein